MALNNPPEKRWRTTAQGLLNPFKKIVIFHPNHVNYGRINAGLAPLSAPPSESIFEITFSDIYLGYHGLLRHFAYGKLREGTTAEDIASESLIRAHASASRLTPDSKISPWLYRIATNLCTDHLRQRKSAPLSLDNDPDALNYLSPDRDVTEPAALKNLLRSQISEILRQLSLKNPKSAAALVLFIEDGLSSTEVAERLGVTTQAAKSINHRAKEAFRAAWIRQYQDDEVGENRPVLSKPVQQVWDLDRQGICVAEISASLGIKEMTVTGYLRRAKQMLQQD